MSHQPPRLRVLLVDDQPLFRRALASLIGAQLDMSVVGEAENGQDAADKVRALRPDIVVMDVEMPRANGVDGVRLIRAGGFDTKIVMLTVSEEDDDLFESIKAGANGYLLKNVRPEQLFDDLRGVMRGEAPIAPAIAHKLLDALRQGGPRPRQVTSAEVAEGTALTPREA
ncbi:MAG TPA: response regulator transcription factor, partial [Candidatus Dormibacteraeota bacterium]|nr:response regulator transcription factor [Candidatus Dormibacteraeota bacterium]